MSNKNEKKVRHSVETDKSRKEMTKARVSDRIRRWYKGS